MRDQLINYARAGYPGIYLVSHEEARVEAELKAVAKTLSYGLHAWSATNGLVDTADGNARDISEPLEAVMALAELPENTILLLRDLHQFLDDGNPIPITAAWLTACQFSPWFNQIFITRFTLVFLILHQAGS